MPAPQNLKNHARFDPLWHFFVAPMLLVNFAFAITATVRHWPDHAHLFLWWIVMSIVLFVAVGKARGHSLTAQDRIIRLEERLRYASLLPAEQLPHTHSLTVKQIIALRFASDAELPALIRRSLAENLTPKQIKQSITGWRPDYLRV
ncbi:MAG TPA: DUF6526 family protein [Acidobacteriaceae bacterium]|nr:DUF6526 family protein [Acidobacteriaceae bacterium]